MKRLVREERLKQEGATFVAMRPLGGGGLQDLRATAEKAFVDDRIIFDYIVSCGEDLVPILQGKKSSLETLFPNGDFTRAENLYERAPLSVYFNSIARAALEGFLRGAKARRAADSGNRRGYGKHQFLSAAGFRVNTRFTISPMFPKFS